MSLKRFDEFTKSLSNSSDKTVLKKTTIKDLKKETKKNKLSPPLLSENKRVNENSFLVGQDYKVKVVIDVPKSLVQEYIDKVKEETDKDPLDNFSEAEIAEQIVSFLVKKNLFIDNLSPEFTVGSDYLGTDEKSNSALDADAETLTDDLGIESDETEDGEIEFKNFNKSDEEADKGVSDTDLESDGEIEINSDETKTKELGETIEVDKTKTEKPRFDEIEFENGDEEDKKSNNNYRPKTIGDLKKANSETIEKIQKKENSETVKEEEEEIEDMYAKIGYKIGYNEQYTNMYRAIFKK
jgi:hypothetical protein